METNNKISCNVMADVGHDGVKGKGWDRSQKDQSEYRIKYDLAKGKSDANLLHVPLFHNQNHTSWANVTLNFLTYPYFLGKCNSKFLKIKKVRCLWYSLRDVERRPVLCSFKRIEGGLSKKNLLRKIRLYILYSSAASLPTSLHTGGICE